MTKREQLRERYEEAAFALAMDKIAASEGENYLKLNSRLKGDPAAEVPAKIRRRAERTIAKACRKARAASASRRIFKAVNRAAVLFLVMAIVLATAFTASAGFRASAYRLVMKVFDDHVEYSFDSEAGGNAAKPYTAFKLGWVPEGYSFCQGVRNTVSYSETYQNFSGEYLFVSLNSLSTHGVVMADAEGEILYQGIINGRGVTIYKNECYYAAIPLAETCQCLSLNTSSRELSVEAFIKVIESLSLE